MICADEGGIGGGNKYPGRVSAASVKAFVQILADIWLSYTKLIMAASEGSVISRHVYFSEEERCAKFEKGATAAYLVVC